MARPDPAQAGASVQKTIVFYGEQAIEALIGAFAGQSRWDVCANSATSSVSMGVPEVRKGTLAYLSGTSR